MKKIVHVIRHHEGQPHFVLNKTAGAWSAPALTSPQVLNRSLTLAGDVHEFQLAGSASAGEAIPWHSLPDQPELAEALRFLPQLYGRRWICAVTGCRETSAKFSPEVRATARAAGRIAAELGWSVLTGGLGGVMNEAAFGARSAGGSTLGILPSENHKDANPHIDFVLPSGIGFARNYLMAAACDLMISLPGGTGTLEELCFAIDFRRAVISWGGWEVETVRAIPLAEEKSVRLEVIRIMKDKYATSKLVGE